MKILLGRNVLSINLLDHEVAYSYFLQFSSATLQFFSYIYALNESARILFNSMFTMFCSSALSLEDLNKMKEL